MPFDYDQDKPSMAAGVQAQALEELQKDASIQALHRKLAEQGAAAAQPKGMQSFAPEPGGEDYSMVEGEEPGQF